MYSFLFWLGAAVVLVGCIDILALTYTYHLLGTVHQDRYFASTLEYANPYIGLEELYQSGRVQPSTLEPILVQPRVASQIYVDDLDKVAPRGEHDYWSESWGTMSSNERHVFVTPQVRSGPFLRIILPRT